MSSTKALIPAAVVLLCVSSGAMGEDSPACAVALGEVMEMQELR